MFGINTYSSQWCGFIFILCCTHLNSALLLQKTFLVKFLIGATVQLAAMNQERSSFYGIKEPKKADNSIFLMFLYREISGLFKEVLKVHFCPQISKVQDIKVGGN